jgi:hypothetical protein
VYIPDPTNLSLLTDRPLFIQARHFWIYHLIDQGVVRLVYVSTDKIVADVLTKALSYDIFMQHVRKLGFVKG